MVKFSKKLFLLFLLLLKNEEHDECLIRDKVEKCSVILNRDISLNLTFVTVTQLFPRFKKQVENARKHDSLFLSKIGMMIFITQKEKKTNFLISWKKKRHYFSIIRRFFFGFDNV